MPDIQIQSLEARSFGAYCALPEGGHGPVIIVIQEIFGVNATMRAICDGFAAQGYVAVCPDLFWRQEPGIQITDKTEAEWARAFELFKGFDVEAGMRDLLSTLAHVRAMKACNGKVGVVGYCLGGKLAYLMATRSDVDAVSSYYGVGLENYLDEIHDIRMPTIMHIAELDQYTPPDIRERLLKAFARNEIVTPYVYEGVDHAFARLGGKNFNQTAADLTNKRTDDLFAEFLHS
ncbi:MAG: dienelactone hydrolase family protein [Alphaproteobacteria bacterium]|nr:dienelactone hydrolase family protein [Alphaproteobacteria bacterium]